MNAGQIGRVEQDVRDLRWIPRHQVDDTRRQTRRLEQLQDVVSAQHRARCRLPDHRVAHQRRRGRKVAGNRREVEGRHRVDEALERSILHAVPHHVAADRLLLVELLCEVRIESPKVDQLRRRIDLRLDHRLRLTQHRRCIQGRPPGGRQQLRCAQEYRRAIRQRPVRPLASRLERRINRLLHVRRFRPVPIGQHVPMVVRDHGLIGMAGSDLAATDHERDVDPLRSHLRKSRLQLGAFWRLWKVGLILVVLVAGCVRQRTCLELTEFDDLDR